MDTQTYVEYEVFNPVSEKRYITESRTEAIAYFEKDWIVVERQITVCKPSLHTQSRMVVLMAWNNNPEFEGV